jgi:hypothetical protein
MALTKNISDEMIVNLIRKGDRSAYTLLYDTYACSLYGIIFRIVKDQASSEKILEQTLIKIWKEMALYHPENIGFFPWMMNIARGLATNGNKPAETIAKYQPDILQLAILQGLSFSTIALKMNISIQEAAIRFRKELKRVEKN